MSESDEKQAVLTRVSIVAEGEFLNAYWAPEPQSLEGAIKLGSIRLACVRDNPERREDFTELMKDCFADMVQQVLGTRPVWTHEVRHKRHPGE